MEDRTRINKDIKESENRGVWVTIDGGKEEKERMVDFVRGKDK